MTRLQSSAAVVAVFAGVQLAGAQQLLQNPDFETGALTPWTISATSGGTTLTPSVLLVDVDGAGPKSASRVARLMVGRLAESGAQGVSVTQPAGLVEGGRYWFRVDWAAHAFVKVYAKSAGLFTLIVDDQPVATAAAPILDPGQRAAGHLRVLMLGTQTRTFNVGVRVTRDVQWGEEVFQYLDNLSLSPACIGDFNQSGDISVGDLFDFLAAYFAGQPDADVNFTRTISVEDVFSFLAAWFAGCP